MARLLVTGGAGFIGSNFVRMAVSKGHEVVVLDKLTYAGNLENIRDLVDARRVAFMHGDVCDPETAHKAMAGCEAVVHFAAETHVDRSIAEAGVFVRTDVYGTFVLLETARRLGLKRFLHISTDEVYGESGGIPCREDAPLLPKSPYAASKAGADRLAFSYHATHNLPVVITRCVNNYGPWQHPEKAVPLFSICALLGEPVPIYGTGENEREWIHVEDHCRALFALLEAPGIEGEVFNVGTGERRSTTQIAAAVLAALDRPKDLVSFVADRPGHVRSHAVDSRKLRDATGWSPSHTFDLSIPDVARWYADHEAWWRTTVAGSAKAYFEARLPNLVRALRRP